MGTGKSTIGRLAAEALRFAFVDTDDLIIERVGRSIPEIFASQGEEMFRTLEKQVVSGLEALDQTVIATGGGVVIDEENLASLKQHALVVCLWASPETVWERVKNQSHRPLLQSPEPLEKIRALLEHRDAFYRRADVLVNTDLRPLREVVTQVLYHFHDARMGKA